MLILFCEPLILGMRTGGNLMVQEEFNYRSNANNRVGLNGGEGFIGGWSVEAGMGKVISTNYFDFCGNFTFTNAVLPNAQKSFIV